SRTAGGFTSGRFRASAKNANTCARACGSHRRRSRTWSAIVAGYHRQVPTVGQTRAYLALTLVVALWGSYPAFAKLALRHLSPFMLVSLRTLLASAFLEIGRASCRKSVDLGGRRIIKKKKK